MVEFNPYDKIQPYLTHPSSKGIPIFSPDSGDLIKKLESCGFIFGEIDDLETLQKIVKFPKGWGLIPTNIVYETASIVGEIEGDLRLWIGYLVDPYGIRHARIFWEQNGSYTWECGTNPCSDLDKSKYLDWNFVEQSNDDPSLYNIINKNKSWFGLMRHGEKLIKIHHSIIEILYLLGHKINLDKHDSDDMESLKKITEIINEEVSVIHNLEHN